MTAQSPKYSPWIPATLDLPANNLDDIKAHVRRAMDSVNRQAANSPANAPLLSGLTEPSPNMRIEDYVRQAIALHAPETLIGDNRPGLLADSRAPGSWANAPYAQKAVLDTGRLLPTAPRDTNSGQPANNFLGAAVTPTPDGRGFKAWRPAADETGRSIQTGPANLDACPPHVKRFFDVLNEPLNNLANRLNIDPESLKALSSYESGWYNAHNSALNNPFGLTHGGGKNQGFDSIDQGIKYFENTIGPKINSSENIDVFIKNLQALPKYNSVNPHYEENLNKQYKSIKKFEKWCGRE